MTDSVDIRTAIHQGIYWREDAGAYMNDKDYAQWKESIQTTLKVTCAWCGADMGEKDGQGQTGETHGICPECYIKELLGMNKLRVIHGGYIATLQTAIRHHLCNQCYLLIEEGMQYYSIVKGGGGLGWLKHPDRTHQDCLVGYLLKNEHKV